MLYVGGCTGFPIAMVHPARVGVETFPFAPGAAFVHGTSLYVQNTGSARAGVWLQGYTVAKAAVQANSTS